MQARRFRRSTVVRAPLRSWFVAGGVLLLCTAVSALLEAYFDHANLILVYMAGMVWVAQREGRIAALAVVVGSILIFDCIFVAPRWSFTPIDPQYYFTFLVMLVVGLLISHLAERARQEAAAAAQAAVEAESERLRSTLLAGISHDFRTPLTTIVGSATSLLQQEHALDEPHRRALLEGVLTEARRLEAMASDLLDLTRMEEGAVRPQCEWCPVDELVAQALQALGGRLAPPRLQVSIPADAVLWCDARLLEQVLVNLLDNALRHTPPDAPIRLRLSFDASGAAVLEVHDAGNGLPAGSERDVFKKFYRLPSAGPGGGTGLGLAICAAVARLHGGRIDAATDGGMLVTLTLPQPPAPQPPPGDLG